MPMVARPTLPRHPTLRQALDDGSWHCFNDAKVKPLDDTEVRAMLGTERRARAVAPPVALADVSAAAGAAVGGAAKKTKDVYESTIFKCHIDKVWAAVRPIGTTNRVQRARGRGRMTAAVCKRVTNCASTAAYGQPSHAPPLPFPRAGR